MGIESSPDFKAPSQLFRNHGDGTFDEIASAAGVTNDHCGKGVICGDYDADRFPDIYVSNLDGDNRLYHNNRDGTFTDVAPSLGVTRPEVSFPTWFWDYNNDGVLDIYVAAYARPDRGSGGELPRARDGRRKGMSLRGRRTRAASATSPGSAT